jgi:hypothetical protein
VFCVLHFAFCILRFAFIHALFFYFPNISPTNGTIQAFQQVVVGVHFQAVKPLTVKKTLRIEANDLESGSTVQTESIVVSAESYNALIDVRNPPSFSLSPPISSSLFVPFPFSPAC